MSNSPQNLLPKDGEVYLFPTFFSGEDSDRYFKTLLTEVPWKHEPIVLFGREIMQPRLTAWYGDSDENASHRYSYSGITMQANPWTPTLLEMKRRIEPVTKTCFNGALLNQYRDGKDGVGWHRDSEKELGQNPVIGSVSLGATRTFRLRHKQEKNLTVSVDLAHGNFLLMRGSTQHYWEHCVPKTKRPIGTRVNITFRILLK